MQGMKVDMLGSEMSGFVRYVTHHDPVVDKLHVPWYIGRLSGMRFVVGLWRLAIAALCITGTSHAWSHPSEWALFTVQIAVLVAFVMAWSGAAELLRGIEPPAWLRGAAVTYAVVIAVGAFTILPAGASDEVPQLLGMSATTMLYYMMPALVILDFLLFDRHRQLRAIYPVWWLLYVPVYIAFIMIRAWWWPHAGPGAGGSSYPYGFLDLSAISAAQFGITSLRILAAFLVAGVVVCIIDRVLPERPLVGSRR